MGLFGQKKATIEATTNIKEIASTILAITDAQKLGLLADQRGVKEGLVTEMEMAMVTIVADIVAGDDDKLSHEFMSQLCTTITMMKMKHGSIPVTKVLETVLNIVKKHEKVN